MKLKYIKDPKLNLIADLQKGWKIYENGRKIIIENNLGFNKFKYDSLEDFNKEWVTLEEPLLQGKIRESLKLWAEYHGVKKLSYRKGGDYSWFSFYDSKLHHNIDYDIDVIIYGLEAKEYCLIELVGE